MNNLKAIPTPLTLSALLILSLIILPESAPAAGSVLAAEPILQSVEPIQPLEILRSLKLSREIFGNPKNLYNIIKEY